MPLSDLASKPIWWAWQSVHVAPRTCCNHHGRVGKSEDCKMETSSSVSMSSLYFARQWSHFPIPCLGFPKCRVVTSILVLYLCDSTHSFASILSCKTLCGLQNKHGRIPIVIDSKERLGHNNGRKVWAWNDEMRSIKYLGLLSPCRGKRGHRLITQRRKG